MKRSLAGDVSGRFPVNSGGARSWVNLRLSSGAVLSRPAYVRLSEHAAALLVTCFAAPKTDLCLPLLGHGGVSETERFPGSSGETAELM